MSTRKVRKWYGNVGALMQEHIALRESMGKTVTSETVVLDQLNGFMKKYYPKLKTPNRYVILHFLNTKKERMLSGRRNALTHVRQFCRFLNQRGISCYVPDKTLLPKLSYKPRYFPLNQDDLKNLLAGLKTVRAAHPIVGRTYAVIVGLLWCTGMRRREALNLNHSDVDLKARTILIRETKFYKTRMIPIDKSVSVVLEEFFLEKKKMKFSLTGEAPIFVMLTGKRMRGVTLYSTFVRVVRRIGLRDDLGRSPVIHDLRHNFATQALRRLYSDTDSFPPQTFLNILATYLGHSDMLYSQYYLHPDFDLLLKASERFEKGRRVA